ncbi:MAG: DNA polymerase III subunit beta [Alphaproteobacteria bacterium MarineAlpha5_Bin9]|nr:MAG: DNA polymerase III subunit beta [Alphaproteobacteria bacterium MarineAlpha5_Bin9]|tara:strand:+ start:23069 stop:24184 length:1116 start_codon:yes stop_codon:yes gene_type:complete
MKISIDRNIIFKSLNHVQSIVDKKNTIPILSNILLEASNSNLTLTATDMDLSIKTNISCSVVEEGSITVPAHTLYDIVRKIPDGNEIEFISNDGKKFSIRSGKSKFSLSCLPKDDFPSIAIDSLQYEFSINGRDLLSIIDKTKFAISNEETRYFLNGIYFHKNTEKNDSFLTLVSTDGHRLAKMDLIPEKNIDDLPGVIVPKKTIQELTKLLAEFDQEVVINVDPNKIIFFINNSILISKVIDGNFPDYTKVIPSNNLNVLKVNRELFCEAVDRVSTITNERSRAIKFRLFNNLVNITASNSENGSASEDIQAEYNGKEIEIGFNSKYILEMISQLEDEYVILKFNDENSPMIANESSNANLIYVLMPMRV